MAHYAQLDESNVVLQVIVVSNNDELDEAGNESEAAGIAFCKSLLGADTRWAKTSYNHGMRKRYAGIGYTFNEELDAFVAPQPYPSWTLNTETADWDAPVPRPTAELGEGQFYAWNEENQEWEIKTFGE